MVWQEYFMHMIPFQNDPLSKNISFYILNGPASVAKGQISEKTDHKLGLLNKSHLLLM